MQGISRIPPKPISLTIYFLNSLKLEIREKTDFGEHRLVMHKAETASSSLELGEDGVTDPPPSFLPIGADDDGPKRREGLEGN